MRDGLKRLFNAARFSCLFLLAMPIAASAAYVFRLESQYAPLYTEVEYLEGRDRELGFEDIRQVAKGWISQGERAFTPHGGAARLWARFTVLPQPTTRQLFIAAGPWERIDYFIVLDGQLVSQQRVGALLPWPERTTQITMASPFITAGFATLDMPPTARATIFARLSHDQRLVKTPSLRFALWDAQEVLAGERQDRLFQGIYFGAILLLILYNLALLGLDYRESSYIYYVISLSASAALWGAFFGLTFEFLWPDYPALEHYCILLAMPLAIWSFCQFVRRYLDTQRDFPRTDVLLMWQARAGLLLVPLLLAPPLINQPLSGYASLLAIFVVAMSAIALFFWVTVLALVKRHRFARLFFAAIACSCVGALISFGPFFDLLPAVDAVLHAGQIGGVLTGVILSMGLSLRVRTLRNELSELELADAHRQNAIERERREFIEQQSHALEIKVEERTAELRLAQEKADLLLSNILPSAVIQELKANGNSEPRRYENASILFTDFSGFTHAVSTIPPARLVQELDEIFKAFDEIVADHGLEKIKTIGDAYMAAAGLPVVAEDHAVRCVGAGLTLTRYMERRNQSAAMKWGLRVGIHSGTAIAGIVGKNKFVYDVWGDTVNIANRMERAGEVGRVNISAYTYELVRHEFVCEYRGKLNAKGKGDIDMYFVVDERSARPVDPSS